MRPATDDDLRPIAEMEKHFQPSPWGVEQLAAEFEKPYSRVWVLTDEETDSQIAAFIVFWVMMDEVQIQTLGVDLPFRGLGFGKRILREAVKEGLRHNAKRVVLEVRKSNTSAQQLYQGLGFTILAVRKGFYSNGEDAYQMTLELEGEKAEF